ncbi:hypothetical protein Gpo141_00000488 [Globisporangium polare]
MATPAPAAPAATETNSSSTAATDNEGVCVLKKYSSCSALDKERVLRCQRAGCAKFTHRSCSLRVTEPFRPADEPFRVVCGKRCYNALHKNRMDAIRPGLAKSAAGATKAMSNGGETVVKATRASPNERKKRSPWNCDGPTPEINSLAVLLEWLRVPKNYECWVKGGDETRFQTKASIAAHILGLIKASGVDTDRNPNDVFAKIYQLEKSFAEASGWLRANEKTTDPARLVAGAKKRCTYYYDLVDSMGAQYFKGNNNNNGVAVSTRKRAAAADSSSEESSNTRDASKRQMVGVAAGRELRPRNAELQNKEASSGQAKTTSSRGTAAVNNDKTPENSPTPISITPVLMNHSFLKASSNTALAPRKTTAESVHAAHLAALNASFLLANSLVTANTATPPKASTGSSTTSSSTAIVSVSSTPADASMAAFSGSLRQPTSSSSTLRPKPAILGTTAAGLADMIASKAKPKTTAPQFSTNGSSSNSTSIVSAPTASGEASPMGFSTSMLQVNNSMLQATAEKLQAEAKIATITANTALLRARKTLREEGVPQTEIDAVLPLARH